MDIFLSQVVKPDLREILSYYYNLGGKRLRPAIFYAFSIAFDSKENLAPFLLALELIHTMSLYHDDVIDKSTKRRGSLSAHKKWDTSVAIIGGDILHGLIHSHIINAIQSDRLKNPDRALKFLNDLITDVEVNIGYAVLKEMEYARASQIPSLENSQYVSKMKTAPLFAFSASAAAYLAGKSEIVSKNLYDMGMEFGFAFQLIDDISDFFPSNKGMGNDLRDGKKTPLISLINSKYPLKLKKYLNNSKPDITGFMCEFYDCFMEVFEWIEKILTNISDKLTTIINKDNDKYILSIFNLINKKYILYRNLINEKCHM